MEMESYRDGERGSELVCWREWLTKWRESEKWDKGRLFHVKSFFKMWDRKFNLLSSFSRQHFHLIIYLFVINFLTMSFPLEALQRESAILSALMVGVLLDFINHTWLILCLYNTFNGSITTIKKEWQIFSIANIQLCNIWTWFKKLH
jgi:hypothetical protein